LDTDYGIRIPATDEEGFIENLLADKYSYKVEEPVYQEWEFYDTFDWRLYQELLTFQRAGSSLNLRNFSTGELVESIRWERTPRFAWQFPDSLLKEHIQSLIDVRALLLLSRVFVTFRIYRILNQEEKTVARLLLTSVISNGDITSQHTASYVSLRPVRGYPKYARLLARELGEIGETSSIIEEIYLTSLKSNRLVPGSYCSKLNMNLSPAMPSAEAIKLILRRLLRIMRANEAGIKADVDSEFLHDFRIAVRKTRSILSQLDDVFPPEVDNYFKKKFADLGKVSNNLRDLDVYLLSENKYHSLLPSYRRDDISPLFTYLKEQRKNALQEVINHLNSQNYAQLMKEWKLFLEKPISDNEYASKANVQIIDLAKQKIYKQYRRIIKDGNYILEHTEDELLHALRIECKKLRYLIEFFSSLFPEKKINRLLQQLKKLQDNLGEFNDLAIQQEHLLDLTASLPVNDNETKMVLVAIGYIIQNMENQQKSVKESFSKTFRKFSSDSNKNLFRDLFMMTSKKDTA
jgi:CHAD domain-containing protein